MPETEARPRLGARVAGNPLVWPVLALVALLGVGVWRLFVWRRNRLSRL